MTYHNKINQSCLKALMTFQGGENCIVALIQEMQRKVDGIFFAIIHFFWFFFHTMIKIMKSIRTCIHDTLWFKNNGRLSNKYDVSLNLDQLKGRLRQDKFQEVKSMAAFWTRDQTSVLDLHRFGMSTLLDYDCEMTVKLFAE
ncbi:hypothetical protein Tco_0677764 [Tanacetum coccineum]|uniref:Uncharacterized protein n=1 Tax=Tanacetum coccineum TaxID=301880 RepID=A0ABQ4XDV5_9ASTR